MMDIGYYIIKLNKYLKSVFSVVGEIQIFLCNNPSLLLKKKNKYKYVYENKLYR